MASKKNAIRIEALPADISDEERARNLAYIYKWCKEVLADAEARGVVRRIEKADGTGFEYEKVPQSPLGTAADGK